jgi:hypothetical protein
MKLTHTMLNSLSIIPRWLRFAIFCIPVACTPQSRPEVQPTPSTSPDREAQQVMELERNFWAAEQRGDSAAVNNLLDPNYLYMSSRGGVDRPKKVEFTLLMSGRVHLLSYT